MTKPKLGIEEVLQIVLHHQIDRQKFPVVLVAVRGYYLNTMGKPGANDRGIYDDACFAVTPHECRAYNFNTDPSAYRKGQGRGAEKGMASLKTGVWMYRTGLHKGYAAFVQAGEVTVTRDGVKGNYEDTGWFGINLHKGGVNGTSSLGCQTWPREQFDDAKKFIYAELEAYDQRVFPYVLVGEEETHLALGVVPQASANLNDHAQSQETAPLSQSQPSQGPKKVKERA